MRNLIIGVSAFSLLFAGCSAYEDLEPVEDLNDAWEELMFDEGAADSASCSGVRVPDRGPFNRRIALTFDDGPDLSDTPRVLAVLADHGVTATFFINGNNVTREAHWDLLREMMDDGHIIANHTTTHPNATRVSISSFEGEVSRTDEVLEELGVPESQRFFRFPFGAANCDTVDVVHRWGYNVVGWHIDTADWCFQNATGGVGYCSSSTFRHVPDSYRSDYIGFTLSQARSNGGGVLLMHDVHSFTASQLDSVLTTLKNDGFEFVGLDDVSTFPLLNGQPPEAQPFVGTTCASDSDCNFSISGEQGWCVQWDESPGFCTLACEGYCPDRYGHAGTFCAEALEFGSGLCLSKSEAANYYCGSVEGTEPVDVVRYIGASSASDAEATVCLP
jgi:peptidoglycan/xylan/chitin deacetylase (PgdA/CDA1 family)